MYICTPNASNRLCTGFKNILRTAFYLCLLSTHLHFSKGDIKLTNTHILTHYALTHSHTQSRIIACAVFIEIAINIVKPVRLAFVDGLLKSYLLNCFVPLLIKTPRAIPSTPLAAFLFCLRFCVERFMCRGLLSANFTQ